jgi:hypothetical protein
MACLSERNIYHSFPLFLLLFVMYQPCIGFDLKLGLFLYIFAKYANLW